MSEHTGVFVRFPDACDGQLLNTYQRWQCQKDSGEHKANLFCHLIRETQMPSFRIPSSV